MRQTINKGRTNYFPNSLGGGCPMTAPENMRGYVHYAEKVDGHKVRERSESFKDFFSQATLFWNSLSQPEKDHLVDAARFELGKVETIEVRQRMVELFNQVDHHLAVEVAKGIGITPPAQEAQRNHGRKSPALSMANTRKDSVKGRKVAILALPGCKGDEVMALKDALKTAGAKGEVVAKFGGKLTNTSGQEIIIDKTFLTAASVMYDAIYIPGGKQSVDALKQEGDAIHFVNEAFRHCKAIGATGEGVEMIRHSHLDGLRLADGNTDAPVNDRGVVTAGSASDAFIKEFVGAMAQHRHWNREQKEMVPA
jgi:catalase